MARISIYVPDDLKALMDAAGDTINWSEVARPAFEAALKSASNTLEDGPTTWRRYPKPTMQIDNMFLIVGDQRFFLKDLLADKLSRKAATHQTGWDEGLS